MRKKRPQNATIAMKLAQLCSLGVITQKNILPIRIKYSREAYN